MEKKDFLSTLWGMPLFQALGNPTPVPSACLEFETWTDSMETKVKIHAAEHTGKTPDELHALLCQQFLSQVRETCKSSAWCSPESADQFVDSLFATIDDVSMPTHILTTRYIPVECASAGIPIVKLPESLRPMTAVVSAENGVVAFQHGSPTFKRARGHEFVSVCLGFAIFGARHAGWVDHRERRRAIA